MIIILVFLLFFIIPKTMVLGIKVLISLGIIAIIGFVVITLIVLLTMEFYVAFLILLSCIAAIMYYEIKKA